MKTFSQLKSEIREEIFHQGGEAPNLVSAHDLFFKEAMVDIQRWVECFQKNNTKVFPFCSTFYRCGLTIIEKPERSQIKSLWVVDRTNPTTKKSDADSPIDWCSRVEYQQVDWCEIQEYARVLKSCGCAGTAVSSVSGINASLCKKKLPTPTDEDWDHLPALPLGHHYNQASTDSKTRAYRGVWALYRGRIYIGPWINSSETIIIEYDGTKEDWDDEDIVSEHDDFEEAVRNYVHFNHEQDYGDEQLGRMLEADYSESIQKLVYDCREETRIRDCHDSGQYSGSSQAQTDDFLRPTLEGQGTCDEVEAVLFDPPAGATVAFPTFVVLSTITPEADIYFTTDGNPPNADSTKYTGPFQIGRGTIVRAVAVKGGCYSAVSVSNYDPYLTEEEEALYGALSFWRYCNENLDRAGAWHLFEANGNDDTKWGLQLPSPEEQIVDTIVLYRIQSDGTWDTGQVWSTVQEIFPVEMGGLPFQSYPLVIDDESGQINFDYMKKDLISPLSTGRHFFDMFGDVVLNGHDWYKLIITFRDKEVYLIRDGKTCSDDNPDTSPFPCIPFEEGPCETTTTTTGPTTTTTTTTPEPSAQINLSINHAYLAPGTPVSEIPGCAESKWFNQLLYSGSANFGVRSFSEAMSSPITMYWNTVERAGQGLPCFGVTTSLGAELSNEDAIKQWPNFGVTLNADGSYAFI